MHPRYSSLLCALGLIGLAACGQAAPTEKDAASPAGAPAEPEAAAPSHAIDYGARARARLVGPDGARIGDVWAWQGHGGVLVQIEARELPPGPHGVHFHAIGNCEDAGVYQQSGGHIGKDDGPHGLLHPSGPHRGNLPNIFVSLDSTVQAEFFSPLISIDELSDADGAALIIHTSRDDHQSQPIGGSGARIACARFRPKT